MKIQGKLPAQDTEIDISRISKPRTTTSPQIQTSGTIPGAVVTITNLKQENFILSLYNSEGQSRKSKYQQDWVLLKAHRKNCFIFCLGFWRLPEISGIP